MSHLAAYRPLLCLTGMTLLADEDLATDHEFLLQCILQAAHHFSLLRPGYGQVANAGQFLSSECWRLSTTNDGVDD